MGESISWEGVVLCAIGILPLCLSMFENRCCGKIAIIEKEYRLRLSKLEYDLIQEQRQTQGQGYNNVLVIGDLHEPFSLDKYLEFCVCKYQEFECSEVVFIGDIIDNHYASYHETNADGMGGADELEYAIQRISRWYKEVSCCNCDHW